MTRGSIAIVGAGPLGGALAHKLAQRDCFREILLADEAGNIAAGKALDIQQSGAIESFRSTLIASSDLTRAAGHSIVVLADTAAGGAEIGGEPGLSLLRSIEGLARGTIYVCAGVSQRHFIEHAVRELGVSRNRIVGSTPLAFSAAIATLVAVELGVSAKQVTVPTLGVAPQASVVPWSLATAGATPIGNVMAPPARHRIEARMRHLWPPGPYTLASAAAAFACAAADCSRCTFPGWVVLEGELGVRGRAAALPLTLCPTGVDEVIVPELSVQERVQLENALSG